MSVWFYKKISWFTGCLAILALFGLVVFSANIEIKDVDLWLHLATGKHIVQTLSVPQTDFLSCTIAGKPWINHEWLFQAIVSIVYNNAGIEGLIDLKAAVVFMMFALLLFLGYTRERQFGPTFILLLVLLIYQSRMTLRPDMFSLLFFVFYIFILGMHLERRWSVWIIALIQVLWVNVHGFFIFGPAVILVGLIAEGVKRRARLPFEWNTAGRLSDDEYKRLKWMFLFTLLACLVNPYFVKGALYPFNVLFSLTGESRIFFGQIQELQRPFNWGNLLSWQPFFYYRALIVISFLSFLFNYRKIDVMMFALWSGFLLFSLSAIRNMTFFAFAAYISFLSNFQHMSGQEFIPIRWNNEKFRALSSIILKMLLILWVADYGDRLLLRGYYDFDKFERKSEYGGLSQRNFAHAAADFLVDNGIKGNFFNDFNSGAYLLGRAAPDIKVFIDGRTEVYGGEFYRTYQEIWKGDKELFDKAVDQYHLTGAFLNYVYVPAPAGIIRHLYERSDWVLVYFDYDAAVFLRDIPENRPWIDRYRIDLAQWQTKEAELLKIGTHKVTPYRYINRAYALFNMGFPQKAEQEAREALRVEPYNAKATKLLGRIYNERGEYAKGFENLRNAKLLEPNDMKIRYQIALSLYHLGELRQAKEQCQRILSREPQDKDALSLMALINDRQQQAPEESQMKDSDHDR
jgi:tetratricopeptide (TPR) repeat protein